MCRSDHKFLNFVIEGSYIIVGIFLKKDFWIPPARISPPPPFKKTYNE